MFTQKGEGSCLPEHSQDLSCTNSQEGPFQVMFAGTQRTKEQNELNTRKRKGQDSTKITSASADSRIKFSWKMMSLLVRILCLCSVLMTIFLSVAPFSQFFVTMSSSAPRDIRRVNRWTLCSFGILPADHELVICEENMKSERLTKASDPSTMRISGWYQEPTREDDDPHSPSSNRVSDLTGTERMSYQVRETIVNDEDRLAMKRGDMPPPLQSENSRRSSIRRISFEVGQDAPCHF